MCSPIVIEKARGGIDRRSMLRLSAAAVASAALGGRGALAQRTQPAGPRSIAAERAVDLTHTLSPQFPVFPVPGAYHPLRMETVRSIEEHGFFVNRWELVEHCGTHVDAPAHFTDGGATLEALSPETMILPAAVIDIRERAAADADTALKVDDILRWESENGELPEQAAVLVNSGWDARATSEETFLNSDEEGTLHFPGISPEAAQFLVAERSIVAAGVDTLSLDLGKATVFEAHTTLLGAGIWGIECIANLDRIPARGATLLLAALKVQGASGGPCRLLAMW